MAVILWQIYIRMQYYGTGPYRGFINGYLLRCLGKHHAYSVSDHTHFK